MRPYDLVKELTYALVGIAALTLVLAAVLSSPDIPPVTIAGWAQTDPVDFVTTATSELQGSTTSAGYGAPYNNAGGEQSWGPIAPQIWFGQRIPVDSAGAFVIQPLKTASYGNSELGTALSQWDSANADQQTAWLSAYADALGKATVKDAKVAVADGDYGPLPVMMNNLLGVAQSGGLDGLLMVNGRFYQTDYTQALLFMGDSGYLDGLATDANLTGSQWGMMNETGSYPGQTWLWLYTMWYQVFPFTSDDGIIGLNGGNADLGIIILMTALTVALALVPLIPVLRDIPRWVPIHRLIWKEYYTPKKRSA
ncbi:MAG: hypothetical protein E6I39_05130 [Chloroflexi bacterium]|nr:MAG: hypothetical protein E6I98_00645 [Chloroflexota bacterium]TMF00566.1 MAG: hypothetical protein E6I39_05130 [Chloroflexota bacterium]